MFTRARLVVVATTTAALLTFLTGTGGATAAVPMAGSATSDVTLVPGEDPCTPGQAGVIYGTAGADTLVGTAGDDVICGLGGNDRITGGEGNDLILGGDGDDTISGGNGNDEIYGEAGADVITGDNGRDSIQGGEGADRLSGGNGTDTLDGGAGNDQLAGDSGNDRLFGGIGDDSLTGALGDDLLNGGDGADRLDGGAGTDTCLRGETRTACERGDETLPRTPTTFSPPSEPAGPVAFKGGPGLAGVEITIDSSGGLSTNDVGVHVDRQATYGIQSVAASPAYEVTLTNPKAMKSARVTLPYDPTRLYSPAADLRLASMRREDGLWIPVTGAATVDTVAHTVTMTVPHFSLLTVVQGAGGGVWSSDALKRLFGTTAVRCVPAGSPGSSAGVDVAFAIDTSGSMSSNDPSAQRVSAAKSFLANLRPGDRAAVIDFDSTARILIGLTDVAADSDRQRIGAALDQTADANGGTSISAAVQTATSVLSAAAPGRVRLAILLTDGQSSYDTALTSDAARAGVSFITVALGAGADTALLKGIADGTGGRLISAASASELASVYDDLAKDIIDDNTDTDGDGLTDCEERNGLFSPAMLFLPDLNRTVPVNTFGVFSFTNPELRDTDADGTPDGVEVRRRSFTGNPEFADAFRVLVDAGRTTYFELVTGRPDRLDSDNDGLKDPIFPALTENCPSLPSGTSPFAYDSDGDGASDGVECLNGNNPLVADTAAYAVPNLPPYSLFTPERYFTKPDPIVSYILDGADQYRTARLANRAVYYDQNYDCIDHFDTRGCDALRAWAANTPNDNGFRICLFGVGDCVTDQSQIRDKIREIVEGQRVFANDGTLRPEYIGTYATLLCQNYYSETGRCSNNALISAAVAVTAPVAVEATELDAATTRTLTRQLGPRPVMDGKAIAAITATIAASAIIYRDNLATEQERRDRIERAVRACTAAAILTQISYLGLAHPCSFLPMFLPGEVDAGGAALNDAAAIAADPTKQILQYAPPAERLPVVQAALAAAGKNSSNPRQWYQQYPECSTYPSTDVDCDEYPFFATTRSGPPTTSTTPLGTRIVFVEATQNRAEGRAYRAFTGACPQVTVTPRQPFAVIPLIGPAAAPTDFVCIR